ncbi:MAG TPA: flotillin family protein, partial [Chloroflexia bacterium]|nr:flotillin family protein [Chloroflexia bacterium]
MEWVILAVIVVVVLAAFTTMFRKVGPNEAMIVYGWGLRESRVVKGGGTIVFPMVQTARMLSLELMSFDVAP